MTRELVSAAILTQATDVECECDGLLNYDRSLKFDDAQTAAIAAANAAFLHGAALGAPAPPPSAALTAEHGQEPRPSERA